MSEQDVQRILKAWAHVPFYERNPDYEAKEVTIFDAVTRQQDIPQMAAALREAWAMRDLARSQRDDAILARQLREAEVQAEIEILENVIDDPSDGYFTMRTERDAAARKAIKLREERAAALTEITRLREELDRVAVSCDGLLVDLHAVGRERDKAWAMHADGEAHYLVYSQQMHKRLEHVLRERDTARAGEAAGRAHVAALTGPRARPGLYYLRDEDAWRCRECHRQGDFWATFIHEETCPIAQAIAWLATLPEVPP